MEVPFTPDTEAKLVNSATTQGRTPADVAQEIVALYFEEQARFVEAVRAGEAALDSGEFLTHEQVFRRMERFLRT